MIGGMARTGSDMGALENRAEQEAKGAVVTGAANKAALPSGKSRGAALFMSPWRESGGRLAG